MVWVAPTYASSQCKVPLTQELPLNHLRYAGATGLGQHSLPLGHLTYLGITVIGMTVHWHALFPLFSASLEHDTVSGSCYAPSRYDFIK